MDLYICHKYRAFLHIAYVQACVCRHVHISETHMCIYIPLYLDVCMNKASCCASCLCTGCSCWDEEQVLLLTQVLVAKFFVPLIYGFLWDMDLHGGSRQWSCASLQLGAGRLAGQPQPNVLATPVKVTFDCALLTA